MRLTRRRLIAFTAIGLILMLGITAVLVMRGTHSRKPASDGGPEGRMASESTRGAIKTIRPKRDSSLRVSVEQLATVEAYYQANLRARAAGVVRVVHKDIGDFVHAGELLVDIGVPDLEKEVEQKESVVLQRKQELRAAESAVKSAEALSEVARTSVLLKKTEVTQAESTREYREKRLARYRTLASREAIGPDVVDEQERDFLASVAMVDGSKVGVSKAEADLKEKQVSIEAAQIDVDLKRSLIEVAKKDLERAQAVSDYARILAPFDGVVTQRQVDPGTFVQNATTGQSDSLISVARTDLVTVVAKVPDNAAAFVNRDTEVIIEINELPGVTISGRVTRYSPSISNTDRTMRVEVDLYNGLPSAYGKLIFERISGDISRLGAMNPIGAISLMAVRQSASFKSQKGSLDRLPARAIAIEYGAVIPSLLPGMSGTMRLQIGAVGSGYTLPSTAVYSRSGKPYILEVRNGIAHQVPVRIQINDGTLVKIVTLGRVNGRETMQELTGTEEIIAARQLEYSDGQKLNTVINDW